MSDGRPNAPLFLPGVLPIALSALLAGCGGGGGSGGGNSGVSPVSLEQEREFSGAIGPINAAAAYDRGHWGQRAVVHMIDAIIESDEQLKRLNPDFRGPGRQEYYSELKTNETRHFHVTSESITERTVTSNEGCTNCSREGYWTAYNSSKRVEDTLIAQLIAEPRDGNRGHGVAPRSEIWSYGVGDSDPSDETGVRARALISASERIDSDIIHLNFSISDSLSDADLQAMAQVAEQNDLMTIAAGETNETTSNPKMFGEYRDATNTLLIVGSIDGSNQLNSMSAGESKNSFIVAPGEELKVEMWSHYYYNDPYPCGFLLGLPILYCDDYKRSSNWDTYTVSGSRYAQAVATGAAAVLRSAYPYLSAAEIKSLMLTTATDLGAPGVDEVYGHGLIDLDRATQPVGELAIAEGQSVDGASASVTGTRLTLGPAFGDALVDNAQLAAGVAFDDFGRPFTVGLDRRVDHQGDGFGLDGYVSQPDMVQGSTRFGDIATLHMATERIDSDQPWATSLTGQRDQDTDGRYSMALDVDGGSFGKLRMGVGTSPQSVLGLSSGDLALASDDLGFVTARTARLPQLDLVGGGAGASLTSSFAPGTDMILGLHSSAAGIDLADGERHAVQALARHRLTDRLTVGVGAGLLDEQGTFLASESSGAFGEGAESQAAFGSLLGRYALGKWSLEGSWTLAAARPSLGADSMLGDLGTVYADSWSMGLIRRNVLDVGDRLGLMLGQPFRVTSAQGTLDVPVSRDFDGNVIRSSEQVNLEPSGREIDLELAYARELGDATSLDTHVFLRREPGHDANAEPDLGLVARVNWHW